MTWIELPDEQAAAQGLHSRSLVKQNWLTVERAVSRRLIGRNARLWRAYLKR